MEQVLANLLVWLTAIWWPFVRCMAMLSGRVTGRTSRGTAPRNTRWLWWTMYSPTARNSVLANTIVVMMLSSASLSRWFSARLRMASIRAA